MEQNFSIPVTLVTVAGASTIRVESSNTFPSNGVIVFLNRDYGAYPSGIYYNVNGSWKCAVPASASDDFMVNGGIIKVYAPGSQQSYIPNTSQVYHNGALSAVAYFDPDLNGVWAIYAPNTNIGSNTWVNPNGGSWQIADYSGGVAVEYLNPINNHTTIATITQAEPNYLSIDIAVDLAVESIADTYGFLTVEVDSVVYNVTSFNYADTTINIVLDRNITYTPGTSAVLYYRDTSQNPLPVTWFDSNLTPFGASNFRGAIIQYHAYTNDGTVIGTIHTVSDSGADVTHTEAISGNNTLQFYEFWVSNESTLKMRINDPDDPGATTNRVWIQWTAKVFYSSEYYC